MYKNNGVGLAAPQVGEHLRMFVIDVSNPDGPINPMIFINPKIIEKSEPVICNEGCLSFPAVFSDVVRYKNVKVKALNINGKPFVIEAKDGELLSRAIQHEFDHLEGILFVDRVVNRFDADAALSSHNLPPVNPDKMIEPEGNLADIPKLDNAPQKEN
jgi:peptide deformylase